MTSAVLKAFAVVDAYANGHPIPCEPPSALSRVDYLYEIDAATAGSASRHDGVVAVTALPAHRYRTYDRALVPPDVQRRKLEAAALADPLAKVLPAFRVRALDVPCPFHTHPGTARCAMEDLWHSAEDMALLERQGERCAAWGDASAGRMSHIASQSHGPRRVIRRLSSSEDCDAAAPADTRHQRHALHRHTAAPRCDGRPANGKHNRATRVGGKGCRDEVRAPEAIVPPCHTMLPSVVTGLAPPVTPNTEFTPAWSGGNHRTVADLNDADAQEAYFCRRLRRQRNQLRRVYHDRYPSGALGVTEEEAHKNGIMTMSESRLTADTDEFSCGTQRIVSGAWHGRRASHFGSADAKSSGNFWSLPRRKAQPTRVHACGAGEPSAHLRGACLFDAAAKWEGGMCGEPIRHPRLSNHPVDNLLGAVFRDE